MKETSGKLIETIERTESIKSFRFLPDEKIHFSPGQFLQLIFDEKDRQNRLMNKYLSFSCAPQREYIEVTKRLSNSEFSLKLKQLHLGERVLLRAPMGDCVFSDEYTKIGFLIGGIGITPVISIIEYIIEKKVSTSICLLYSNRFEDDIAFRQELNLWQTIYPHLLHVVYLVNECKPKDKQCLYGIITKNIVITHMADWRERVIFVFGPPTMVNIMKDICSEISCQKGNIKTETFAGY